MINDQKVMLVTGGTSGIGKETVYGLAATGATVIFTARDEEKGRQMEQEVRQKTNNNAVYYILCDLSSLALVKKLADDITKRWNRLDVVIHNAGVMPRERKESHDGIEMNFAVNFLAPVLLTYLLMPLLKASAPSRIINVSSTMHQQGTIDFDDLEGEKSFNHYKAYAQSKLALLLFTKKLATDLTGSGVSVNALHPGVVATEMTMQSVRQMNPFLAFAYKRTLLSPAQGAKTGIYLATSPDVANDSGKYFVACKQARVAPAADNMEDAARLMAITEKTYLAPYLL